MSRFIVTNDDGVFAPGIQTLVDALRPLGEVQVVAPASNQSASGHKKTLFRDIHVEEVTMADGTPAYAVDSAPADCIALCGLGLCEWPPQLVVSGINRGANMGQDVTYSGTVTAALEATIHGVPALAVSKEVLVADEADELREYEHAAQLAAQVASRILERGLPPFTILSLNVPAVESRGLRLTRQGVRIYNDVLRRNGSHYQIAGDPPTGDVDEVGTDLWAVHRGFASLTPLHLDLTRHRFLAELSAWDLPWRNQEVFNERDAMSPGRSTGDPSYGDFAGSGKSGPPLR
ncbi:MAG: 5'/3'-nucleotidase SurE [Anaerolineaceae bacterium]|nr:5'/3'-nucleotidase SurE [Anaerolineaceae bacterium]